MQYSISNNHHAVHYIPMMYFITGICTFNYFLTLKVSLITELISVTSLLKDPVPKYSHLGIKAQTYKFWGHTVHSTAGLNFTFLILCSSCYLDNNFFLSE